MSERDTDPAGESEERAGFRAQAAAYQGAVEAVFAIVIGIGLCGWLGVVGRKESDG